MAKRRAPPVSTVLSRVTNGNVQCSRSFLNTAFVGGTQADTIPHVLPRFPLEIFIAITQELHRRKKKGLADDH